MAPTLLNAFLAAALATAVSVRAESHTIKFNNQCGYGTPQLILNGEVVSSGEDYTGSGSLSSGIAYLQTGACDFNGEQCTLIEMTLGNPTCEGCGSSADISLITPHAFNVAAGFSYFDGCDGDGAWCDSADCSTAFFQPDDTTVQVACQTDNVGLLISFCSESTSGSSSSSSFADSTTSSSATPTSTSSTAVATTSSTPSSSSVASSTIASSSAAASSAAPTCSSKRKRSSKTRREAKNKRSNHSRHNAARAHHA